MLAASIKNKDKTGTPAVEPIDPVSSFTFGLFIYFNIDLFLRLSARIPGYGVIRPTLLLVLCLTFLLYAQRHKAHDLFQTEPFKKIKYLLIYLMVSFLLVRWPGSALSNLPEFVKAICFFFFISLVVDSRKRLKLFLFVFIACQLFRVYEPLYMNLTSGYWGSKTYIGSGEFAGRLAGAPADVINPNELGFVIATITPFLYYLLWRNGFKEKILFLIVFPPLLYALVLTMSRGALVALLVVCWMIFKESSRKFTLIITGLFVAMLGWSVMSDLQKDRYLSLFEEDSVSASTAQGRFDGMQAELVLGLTTRPLLGNGLGTTQETKYHEWGRSKASHILYGELIIEIGLIGMVIFLLYLKSLYGHLVGMLVFQTNVASKGYSDPFWFGLTNSMFALFWMYIVYSTNYWGLSVYYWYFFGGLLVASRRIIVREKALIDFRGDAI